MAGTTAVRVVIGGLTGALILGGGLAPAPASGDPGDPGDLDTLIIDSGDDPRLPGVGSTTIGLVDNLLTVHNPGGSTTIPPQCNDLPSGSVCVGSSDILTYPGSETPVDIRGWADQYRALGDESLQALEDEAVSAISLRHNITDYGAIRTYARPEIRAYITQRIIDILDRKLYGQPLTTVEQDVYDQVVASMHAEDVRGAEETLAEYQRWSAGPCTYDVPPPPAGSSLPFIPNEVATSSACLIRGGGLGQLWRITRDVPSVETFRAWASYRNPDLLLANQHRPELRRAISDTAAAVGTTAAIAAAAAGAAATYALVIAAGYTVASNIAAVLGVGHAMWQVINGTIEISSLVASAYSYTTGAASAAAASSAATIVGVVLFAAVTTAMATWKVVEEQQTIQEIKAQVERAASDKDPLGIAAAAPSYQGLDFEERERPSDPGAWAPHHRPEFFSMLMGKVATWTMFDSRGRFHADPAPDAPPTGAADIRFDDGSSLVETVQVKAPPGSRDAQDRPVTAHRVRFSGGWLVVSDRVEGGYGPWRRTLRVPYVAPNGQPGVMTPVAMTRDGMPGTYVATVEGAPDQRQEATLGEQWSYQVPSGATQVKTLQAPPMVTPRFNVLPTAEGTFYTHRNVRLMANPSDPSYGMSPSFSWTVRRQVGDSWVDVPLGESASSLGFSRRFDDPGRYLATVEMTGNDVAQGAVATSGRVEFVVKNPAPRVESVALDDDPSTNSDLFLDLRLNEERSSDVFEVEVDWAIDASGNTVSRRYTVQCLNQSGDSFCSTGAFTGSGDDRSNPNWSASPLFRLPDDHAYLPFVQVRITNQAGLRTALTLPLLGEHRPRIVERRPYVRIPVGVDGLSVPITEVIPAVGPDVTSSRITLLRYLDDLENRIPEGLRLDVEQIGGRPHVVVEGEAQADDIGLYDFRLPVEQEPIGSGLVAPSVPVTLEVVSSTDPGYRAVLWNTRAGFQTARAELPDFVVRVPQVLASDEQDFAAFNGTVMCRLRSVINGEIFTKPCAPERRFPWPSDLGDGIYEAEVWAESDDQAVVSTPYRTRVSIVLVRPTLTARPTKNGRRSVVRLSLVDFGTDSALGTIRPPFDEAGFAIRCAVDGRRARPCLTDGTLRVVNSPGRHRVTVDIVAPDGTRVQRTVTWRAATPPRRLQVRTSTRAVRAGASVRIRARGLLPQERFTVRVAGRRVAAGRADLHGVVGLKLRIPNRIGKGTKTIVVRGVTPQRKGTIRIRVR